MEMEDNKTIIINEKHTIGFKGTDILATCDFAIAYMWSVDEFKDMVDQLFEEAEVKVPAKSTSSMVRLISILLSEDFLEIEIDDDEYKFSFLHEYFDTLLLETVQYAEHLDNYKIGYLKSDDLKKKSIKLGNGVTFKMDRRNNEYVMGISSDNNTNQFKYLEINENIINLLFVQILKINYCDMEKAQYILTILFSNTWVAMEVPFIMIDYYDQRGVAIDAEYFLNVRSMTHSVEKVANHDATFRDLIKNFNNHGMLYSLKNEIMALINSTNANYHTSCTLNEQLYNYGANLLDTNIYSLLIENYKKQLIVINDQMLEIGKLINIHSAAIASPSNLKKNGNKIQIVGKPGQFNRNALSTDSIISRK